jgi:serine/threonine-protein kinase
MTGTASLRVLLCLCLPSAAVAAEPAKVRNFRLRGTPAEPASPYFPSSAPWSQDVSAVAVDPESDTIIGNLAAAGGWGNGNKFQIDISIQVLQADASAPMMPFNTTADFFSPDCDHVPVPMPPGGALEGEDGYACLGNGDCHLIVVHQPTRKLYEMWRADIRGGVFNGGCLAVWDLNRDYGALGRGDGCTSADAAGYPIAPLLINPDEVAAGEVPHAIRFILPNSRMRHQVYVHPATHSTSATGGGAGTIPYGARLRLRPDYPVDALPSQGAKVIARGLQKYGMFLADGGQIALTAQDDRFTTAKWSNLLKGTSDLSAIRVTDFQMIDGGARIVNTDDCIRVP